MKNMTFCVLLTLLAGALLASSAAADECSGNRAVAIQECYLQPLCLDECNCIREVDLDYCDCVYFIGGFDEPQWQACLDSVFAEYAACRQGCINCVDASPSELEQFLRMLSSDPERPAPSPPPAAAELG